MAMVQERSRRPVAFAVLITAAIVGVPLLMGMVGLLREQLRFHCQLGTEGEAAGYWHCPDGLSYVLPGLGILFIYALCALAGVILVVAGRPRWVAALAILPGAVPVLISVAAVTQRPGGYEPEVDWRGVMLVPTIAIAAASIAILLAAAAVAWRRMLLALAALWVLVAAVAQPTIAGFCVLALGLLAAAFVLELAPSVRRTPSPAEESAER